MGRAVDKAEIVSVYNKCEKYPECLDCTFHDKSDRVVGMGNPEADIMIIGSSPQKEHIINMSFFVDNAFGRIMASLLNEVGLDFDDFYMTNIVQCYIGSKKIGKKLINQCAGIHLDKQIKKIKPKVIVAMGPEASIFLNKGKTINNCLLSVERNEEYNCDVVTTYGIEAVTFDLSKRPVVLRALYKAKDLIEFGNKSLVKRDWKVVENIQELRELKKKLDKVDIFAGDLETTGFDFIEDSIICAPLSWEEGIARCIVFLKRKVIKDVCSECNGTGKIEGKISKKKKCMICKGKGYVKQFEGAPFFGDDQEEAWQIFKDIMESNTPKVFQNYKFDKKFLMAAGIKPRKMIFDTMLAHYLLNENLPHSLTFLSKMYTDMGDYDAPLEEYKRKHRIKNYLEIPTKLLAEYACGDADCTFRLFRRFSVMLNYGKELDFLKYERKIFRAKLKGDVDGAKKIVKKLHKNISLINKNKKKSVLRKVFMNILLPLQEVLCDMEFRGIKMDIERWDELEKEEEKLLIKLEKEMQEIAGTEECTNCKGSGQIQGKIKMKKCPECKGEGKHILNPRSTKQLKELLFGKFGLRSRGETASGAPSTAEGVLEQMKDEHPFIEKLLDYRKHSKLYSTYIMGMRKLLSKNNTIHTSYLLHGTACVTADTTLWTSRGLEYFNEIYDIDSLPEGKFIPFEYSLLGENAEVKTSHIYKSEPADLYKIETVLGIELRGTKNHPIRVLQGNKMIWKSLGDIQRGDYVCTRIGANVWGQDVKLSDSFYVRKTNAKKIKLPNKLTPELARLLGYIVAEGNITIVEKYGIYKLSITNTDKNVQTDIIALLKKLFNINTIFRTDGNTPCVQIVSKELILWFQNNFGIKYDSINKDIPHIIRKAPWCIIKEFLRGLMTDAYIGRFKWNLKGKKVLVRYVSSSKVLMKEVQQLLLNRGYHALFGKMKKYRNIKKYTRTGHDADNFMYRVQLMDNSALNFINECKPITKKHLKVHKKLSQIKKVSQQHVKQFGKFQCVQVKKVTQSSSELTYDVTVPVDSTFITNGIISHNTGRLSSNNPNLQNIPKKSIIEELFVARPGYAFVGIDYAQAEFRVLAHYCDDENLIKVFEEGEDIHASIASRAFNIPYQDIIEAYNSEEGSKERTIAKSIGFGMLYGRSAFSLHEQLGISLEEADAFVEKFFNGYPKIRQWIEEQHTKVCRDGRLESFFGRVRRLPDIDVEGVVRSRPAIDFFEEDKMRDKFTKSFLSPVQKAILRQSQNFPIQSAASDITCLAMIKIHKIIKEKKLGARILMNVHDAIYFEIPIENLFEEIEIIQKAMLNPIPEHLGIKFKVPLGVDIGIGKSWRDLDKPRHDITDVDRDEWKRDKFGLPKTWKSSKDVHEQQKKEKRLLVKKEALNEENYGEEGPF